MIPSQTLYYNYANSLPRNFLPLGMPVLGNTNISTSASQNASYNPALETYLNALRWNPTQAAYQKAEADILNSNSSWEDSFSYTPLQPPHAENKKLS